MGELETRAVSMPIPMGVETDCVGCDNLIRFIPPGKGRWIVANVYEGKGKNRRWNRLENYHSDCYQAKGCPYGEAPVRKAQIIKRTSW